MFALRLAMKKLSDNDDDGDVAEPVGNDWGNGRERVRGEKEKKATLSLSLSFFVISQIKSE